MHIWMVILYRQLDETLELMSEVLAADINLGASMFNYYVKPWDWIKSPRKYRQKRGLGEEAE